MHGDTLIFFTRTNSYESCRSTTKPAEAVVPPGSVTVDASKDGRFASTEVFEAKNAGDPDLEKRVRAYNNYRAEMLADCIDRSTDRSVGLLGRMMLRFTRRTQ